MALAEMLQDTRPAELDAHAGPDAWADFRVDDGIELLRLLKQLRDTGVPVTLNSPQGAALCCQLWSIDSAQRQLSFSADASDPRLEPLAYCDEAIAVAFLDRVKLQFDLGELVLVHGASHCALRARLPSVLYRFQRRASYRVRTPERRAPQVVLRHPSMPEMQLVLRIVDLSAGGCALLLPDDVPALQPGSSLGGVRVELDGDTGFEATLRLQHVSALHGPGQGSRLGCEFVGLEGPSRRLLQRYIDQTQQRRRLLSQP